MTRLNKILFILGGLSAAALPVTAIACNDTQKPTPTPPTPPTPQPQPQPQTPQTASEVVVREIFTNLLSTTHGRKAGDQNNFKTDSLNFVDTNNGKGKVLNGLKVEGEDKRAKTSIVEKSLINKFGDSAHPVNPEHSNYGSYYAYQYLKKQIKDMGYEYHSEEEILYPKYSETASGISLYYGDVEVEAQIISKMKDNLKKDGFFTQGFLYNLKNSWNNIGNNLVVTINPSSKITNNNTINVKDFYIVSHYDSTNNVGPKGTSWGATDNASGVAVNLALLKHFSKAENRDKLGVRLHLIFVDAEELGKLGSTAFVSQFLYGQANRELLQNSLGMINMDTVAGGDYMYIHSPDTRGAQETYNTSPLLRDFINKISKERVTELKDDSQELKIHPQFVENEFKQGETGDWSDHAPFYQIANLPVAYVESTNFGVKSKNKIYDGYAQTTNPKAWVLKDGKTTLADQGKTLLKRTLENGQVVYDWPEGMTEADFAVLGDIWHSDLDTLQWINDNIGRRFYKQLDTVFNTLTRFLKKMYTKTENTITYQQFNKIN
ncbi:M28 family peptidase [Mycoplasmopsis arginini]|uniref:M28 family metallopeptidase n=1 Tax=Mycoplasmopsis arginini TaxID=2094 RepID=UPI00249F0A77|nr:M28 family peptidase [Mycoplasmopsis arginini]MDI3351229.1 M28 family peptidase [Mycoplasmopsis arginini]